MGEIADFSEYQNTIDFSKVAQEVSSGKLDGVILRVQAGSTHADTKYKEYVAGCKQHKIPFATYAYFKATSDADAIQEAKDAYSRMDKSSVFFAIDIEAVTCPNLVSAGNAFRNYLKQQGLKQVGIYSGENFYNTHGLHSIDTDFTWIAKYGTNDGKMHTAPSVKYDLWQFTSVGRVSGVSGNVDLSQQATGKVFFPKPVVAPAAVVTKPTTPDKSATVTPTPTAQNGWVKQTNTYFYKDGAKQTGLQIIDSKAYLFDDKGLLIVGCNVMLKADNNGQLS